MVEYGLLPSMANCTESVQVSGYNKEAKLKILALEKMVQSGF